MTLTDRDRRILLFLIPVVIVIAYWFLILSPKRSDLTSARAAQHSAEQARDQAVSQANQLVHARQTFAADYADVIRLGKAIPDTVDSPSLLVQLDRASKGTHIDFNSVTFGARTSSTVPVVQTTTTQGPEQPNGNAAVGGAPAQGALGGAAESAGNAVTTANQASTAAGGTETTSTTTTTTSGTTPAPPSTTSATLDTVPLTFNFSGTYFDLADFFHRLKRFVYVANDQIFVRGRLLSIDTLAFTPAAVTPGAATGRLTATVGATIYLSPAGQGGVTAGATPTGPPGTTTETTTTPAGSQTSKVPLASVTGAR